MSKNEKKKVVTPKIECNVVDCMHNCIENSTCKLDAIRVCNCTGDKYAKKEDGTACSSYDYAGDLNEEGVSGRD